jgi:hypothetical protein
VRPDLRRRAFRFASCGTPIDERPDDREVESFEHRVGTERLVEALDDLTIVRERARIVRAGSCGLVQRVLHAGS